MEEGSDPVSSIFSNVSHVRVPFEDSGNFKSSEVHDSLAPVKANKIYLNCHNSLKSLYHWPKCLHEEILARKTHTHTHFKDLSTFL